MNSLFVESPSKPPPNKKQKLSNCEPNTTDSETKTENMNKGNVLNYPYFYNSGYLQLPTGYIFGNYKIINGSDNIHENFIGKGSFGLVYLCENLENGRKYVVKIIKNERRYIKAAIQETILLSEISEQQKCDNHNLVKFIESFYLFESIPVLVFEFAGKNLYKYSKNNLLYNSRAFTYDLVIQITNQILKGLKKLRELNIIHCDLKPENICYDDSTGEISIIDFGSSRKEGTKETTISYEFTRYYRPPELPLELGFDCKSDIWSLGCIVYELYTGMPLFPVKSSYHQCLLLKNHIQVLGMPPKSFCDKHPTKNVQYMIDRIKDTNIGKWEDKQHILKNVDEDPVINFISKCLKWDPDERITPEEALNDPLFTSSLPKKVLKTLSSFV